MLLPRQIAPELWHKQAGHESGQSLRETECRLHLPLPPAVLPASEIAIAVEA
jgi:hypothetical protein